MYQIKNIIVVILLLATTSIESIAAEKHTNQNSQPVSIVRFDKDFYTYLSNPTNTGAKKMLARYPTLFPAFGQITVGKMIHNDTIAFYNALSTYFSHPELKDVYKDEMSKFSDISACEKQLTKAQTIAKSLLPDKNFPRFAIHVSGFRENIIAVEGIISLSADKYMGADYTGYHNFFDEKERSQMEPLLMPRDYLKAWIISENMILKERKRPLLATVIEKGKLLYLLSKLLPENTPHDIAGISKKEMEWFDKNEQEAWKTLKKLLPMHHQLTVHCTDEDICKANNYPAWTGTLIGLRIVEQYATNTGLPMNDILSQRAETMLKEAKYKP